MKIKERKNLTGEPVGGGLREPGFAWKILWNKNYIENQERTDKSLQILIFSRNYNLYSSIKI